MLTQRHVDHRRLCSVVLCSFCLVYAAHVGPQADRATAPVQRFQPVSTCSEPRRRNAHPSGPVDVCQFSQSKSSQQVWPGRGPRDHCALFTPRQPHTHVAVLLVVQRVDAARRRRYLHKRRAALPSCMHLIVQRPWLFSHPTLNHLVTASSKSDRTMKTYSIPGISPVLLLASLALAPTPARSDMPQWAACMAACSATLVVCLETYAFRGTT